MDHFLAIMNIAVINTSVQMSFWQVYFISFWYIPSCAGSYSTASFAVLRTLQTVSYKPVLIYIPTNIVQGFPFLSTLTSAYLLPSRY
jgi:hypothetical protein